MQLLMDDVVTAMKAGTFTARDDVHLSWTPGFVDEQGWTEMVDLVNGTLEQAIEIQGKSANRLAKAGEKGIPATIALMHFEGVDPDSKSARSKRGKAKAAKKS